MLKKFIIAFSALHVFFYVNVLEAQEIISFSPEKGIHATVSINDHTALFSIKNSKGIYNKSIMVDTEKPLHVTSDDYNFDGKKDFSIWHMDDGMGTYTIHRVFLFSPSKKTFIEVFPDCGDEFINLKVDPKNKKLISTFYEDNVPALCGTMPHIPR